MTDAAPSPPPTAPSPAVPTPPPTLDLTIAALDHQGRGVGQADDGITVNVPFTLPGERVQVRVWRHNAPEGALADLVSVLSPAPDRVTPVCSLFGVCAGCQLQHLAYPRQLDWKAAIVRALAAPLGLTDAVASCIGSPRPFGYRSKITPHHDRRRPDRPLAIGFLKIGRRHEVVDVERCPLATDGINARLPALRAEIAAQTTRTGLGASFLLREATSGVTTDPDARVTERVGGVALEFFAREFFQNNPFLLPSLLDFVLAAAAGGGNRLLVDAYSGSGLFALSAARLFDEVIGVEVSAGAVVAARGNAARNDLTNVRFVAADASRIFAQLENRGGEASVIVDPPRKGCGPAFLTQLVAFAPSVIVYVSCNPETLCADLRPLMAAGYTIGTLQPFDMFPQTRHVECVAVLRRAE